MSTFNRKFCCFIMEQITSQISGRVEEWYIYCLLEIVGIYTPTFFYKVINVIFKSFIVGWIIQWTISFICSICLFSVTFGSLNCYKLSKIYWKFRSAYTQTICHTSHPNFTLIICLTISVMLLKNVLLQLLINIMIFFRRNNLLFFF